MNGSSHDSPPCSSDSCNRQRCGVEPRNNAHAFGPGVLDDPCGMFSDISPTTTGTTALTFTPPPPNITTTITSTTTTTTQEGIALTRVNPAAYPVRTQHPFDLSPVAHTVRPPRRATPRATLT